MQLNPSLGPKKIGAKGGRGKQAQQNLCTKN
jgi:hypothetical protein